MSLKQRLHSGLVAGRRARVLSRELSALIPPDSRVLDVGCGDGEISWRIAECRPDLEIRGIEVFLREKARIPVEPYDGERIPHPDRSFDVVLFVDVLHHTEEPAALLREAKRVARRAIVIKDHTRNGLFANATLRLMDRVGNPSQGVALPYNYWSREQWMRAFRELGLRIETWLPKLRLFLPPADWIFGRSLHFIARLESS